MYKINTKYRYIYFVYFVRAVYVSELENLKMVLVSIL